MIPGKKYTPELILQIAWRSKWWILLPALAISVAVAVWTRSLTNQYRSDAVILVVPQQVPEAYVKSTITASVADRLQSISQQILSRTRLERIILDLNLYAAERQSGIMEDVVDGMRQNIDVQTVRNDSFRVSFTSEDPRTAMRVTERLGSLFIDESLRDREVLAEGTSQFLEAQLEDARRQLIDNEKRLEEFRRSHDGQLPTQLQANMQGLHNTEMQLQDLQEALNRDRDRLDSVKRLLGDLQADDYVAPSTVNLPAMETAADRYRNAEAEFAAMQRRLKPDHPDIVRARRLLGDLKKAADEEAAATPSDEAAPLTAQERLRRSRITDASREIEILEREIAEKVGAETKLRDNLTAYQRRIEGTPTRESELIELTRDYSTLQGIYQSLLEKKQESQISANLERRQIGEQFRILDPARLPSAPFTPDRPRYYSAGVLAGLAVGLGLALLLEYLDRSLRSEDDVRVAIGLPVLATVPFIVQGSGAGMRALIALAATSATVAFGAIVYLALRLVR